MHPIRTGLAVAVFAFASSMAPALDAVEIAQMLGRGYSEEDVAVAAAQEGLARPLSQSDLDLLWTVGASQDLVDYLGDITKPGSTASAAASTNSSAGSSRPYTLPEAKEALQPLDQLYAQVAVPVQSAAPARTEEPVQAAPAQTVDQPSAAATWSDSGYAMASASATRYAAQSGTPLTSTDIQIWEGSQPVDISSLSVATANAAPSQTYTLAPATVSVAQIAAPVVPAQTFAAPTQTYAAPSPAPAAVASVCGAPPPLACPPPQPQPTVAVRTQPVVQPAPVVRQTVVRAQPVVVLPRQVVVAQAPTVVYSAPTVVYRSAPAVRYYAASPYRSSWYYGGYARGYGWR